MPLTFGPLGNKKNPKRVRHTKPKKTNPLDLISFNQISDPHHLERTNFSGCKIAKLCMDLQENDPESESRIAGAVTLRPYL